MPVTRARCPSWTVLSGWPDRAWSGGSPRKPHAIQLNAPTARRTISRDAQAERPAAAGKRGGGASGQASRCRGTLTADVSGVNARRTNRPRGERAERTQRPRPLTSETGSREAEPSEGAATRPAMNGRGEGRGGHGAAEGAGDDECGSSGAARTPPTDRGAGPLESEEQRPHEGDGSDRRSGLPGAPEADPREPPEAAELQARLPHGATTGTPDP